MSIEALPERLSCIFCEGLLNAEGGAEGSLLIKCGGCSKEMIDCDCALDLHLH